MIIKVIFVGFVWKVVLFVKLGFLGIFFCDYLCGLWWVCAEVVLFVKLGFLDG